MRKLLLLIMVVGLLIPAGAAFGQDSTIVIAVEGAARGEEGEVIPVAQEIVDPALVGRECTGTLATENNDSVHPGNTLIIATGDEVVEFPNVEDEPGQVFTIDGTVTVGEVIDVSIRLGPNGITSGGMLITLDCALQETTTTTAPPDATTTTAAATTSTEAAPTGGVATGGGGTADSNQTGFAMFAIALALAAGAGTAVVVRKRSDAG